MRGDERNQGTLINELRQLCKGQYLYDSSDEMYRKWLFRERGIGKGVKTVLQGASDALFCPEAYAWKS
jgi:hypothetical protein